VRRPRMTLPGLVAALCLLAAASPSAAVAAPTTKRGPTGFTILATNDDGNTTPGLGALVQALRKVRGTRIVVAMPATNQSGTDSATSPTPVTGVQTTTTNGYPAYAVNGTPADTVNWALANLGRPTLVVSGVNDGQNLGFFTTLSGTVGAAHTAVRAGIPALAVSQGLGTPVPYDLAAGYAVTWLRQHRNAILHPKKGSRVVFDNLNVPTCATGSVRGIVVVPAATTTQNALAPADCTSKATGPATDIAAFVDGFAPLSHLTP
jgi:5'-nucleotidase